MRLLLTLFTVAVVPGLAMAEQEAHPVQSQLASFLPSTLKINSSARLSQASFFITKPLPGTQANLFPLIKTSKNKEKSFRFFCKQIPFFRLVFRSIQMTLAP